MNARLPILLLAVAGLATHALAGPLDPPAGPVTSTMKTLFEVEPRTAITVANTPGNANAMYVISQPGSYYLTGNIAGTAGKACILVAATQATIDLNGFSLGTYTDGILITTDCTFAIKNGVITGGTGSGVRTTTDLANGTIEDVTAQWFDGSGFALGTGATIRRCTARHCDQPGYLLGANAVVDDCIASQNTSHGFQLGSFSKATDCTAEWSGGNGFQTNASCKLKGCRATEGTGNGFLVTESKLESCESIGNGLVGFDIGSGSSVIHCSARHNAYQGLRATDHNTISASQFRDQTGGANSYAGLWLAGSFNRVDRCEASTNGFGIYVNLGTSQNVVTRSRASGNPAGNFFIAPSNQVAPVVQNPGNSSYATMTPWSNVTY